MRNALITILATGAFVACGSDSPTGPAGPGDQDPGGPSGSGGTPDGDNLTGSWTYLASIEWNAAGEGIPCEMEATLDLSQSGRGLSGQLGGQAVCEDDHRGFRAPIGDTLWPEPCRSELRDLREQMAARGLSGSSVEAEDVSKLAEQCGMLVEQQVASLTGGAVEGETRDNAVTFFAGALGHEGESSATRMSGAAALLHPSDPDFVLAEGTWEAERQ